MCAVIGSPSSCWQLSLGPQTVTEMETVLRWALTLMLEVVAPRCL